jgi:hypothetical protein
MYILSTVYNSNKIAKYDNEISYDYKDFLKGEKIFLSEIPLFFSLNNKSDLKKFSMMPIIDTAGPKLIRKDLKIIMEQNINSNEIQFLEIFFYYQDIKIDEYYAINVTNKRSAIDLEKSEYKIMNFDPNNPVYMFYYLTLKEISIANLDVFICEEFNRQIIISDKIKNILINSNNLKGLKFCKSIDITPLNRSVCEIL